MTPSEIQDKWMKRIVNEVITVEKVDKIPDQGCHLFMIGSQHVGLASDRYGGILSEEVCEEVPCCTCKQPLSNAAHRTITACYIKVIKPCTQKEVSAVLFPIKAEMESDGIDGFAILNHKMIKDWGQPKP